MNINKELLNKSDIESLLEPALLWQNPSPNSALKASDYPSGITTLDMSVYKYTIYAYKIFTSSTEILYKKVKYNADTSGNGATYLSEVMTVSGTANQYQMITREFNIMSATNIEFGSGRLINNGSTSANDNCGILVAIYGTNIL